jgi:septal ring factor EnvC (AmiA/AmiB activator)
MTDDLDAIEGKLGQLLERWQAMREENLRLRQQVVSMENANKQLEDRLAQARDRLQSLYDKIPD